MARIPRIVRRAARNFATAVAIALLVMVYGCGAHAKPAKAAKDLSAHLPWSCWKVKWARSVFTDEQLAQKARDNKIRLTSIQKAAVKQCLES